MDASKMASFVASALTLLKDRLDRYREDTARDEYYTMRIQEAVAYLERKRIVLTDSVDDLMLVVDLAAWNHANRDKQTGQPEWLRDKIRGRWINDGT